MEMKEGGMKTEKQEQPEVMDKISQEKIILN